MAPQIPSRTSRHPLKAPLERAIRSVPPERRPPSAGTAVATVVRCSGATSPSTGRSAGPSGLTLGEAAGVCAELTSGSQLAVTAWMCCSAIRFIFHVPLVRVVEGKGEAVVVSGAPAADPTGARWSSTGMSLLDALASGGRLTVRSELESDDVDHARSVSLRSVSLRCAPGLVFVAELARVSMPGGFDAHPTGTKIGEATAMSGGQLRVDAGVVDVLAPVEVAGHNHALVTMACGSPGALSGSAQSTANPAPGVAPTPRTAADRSVATASRQGLPLEVVVAGAMWGEGRVSVVMSCPFHF